MATIEKQPCSNTKATSTSIRGYQGQAQQVSISSQTRRRGNQGICAPSARNTCNSPDLERSTWTYRYRR
ncbi:hypothetical protein NW759_17734 [Fusarium solani]|nr:hypothetical protein NW759_17734 [Fusarium solani]